MRTLTKSPTRLALVALRAGQEALPQYSSRYSRHDFTQAQLFALLVLRQFFRTDFRGLAAMIGEWPELRDALGLRKVPHFSTLCYAQRRMLEDAAFERLLGAVFQQARQLGLIEAEPDAAIDSTGLDTRHVSRYFEGRRGTKDIRWKSWPKLTAVCHLTTHLFAAAFVCLGPCQDYPQFAPAMRQAVQYLRPLRVLADGGYDSEANHRLARGELGVRSIIAVNPRGSHDGLPKAGFRRLMAKSFPHRLYSQRWQIESAFSSHKRRLGSALSARSDNTQRQELLLRVITHDLMILRRT